MTCNPVEDAFRILNWKPSHLNAELIPNWDDGPDVAAYSNALGREGWELVNLAVSAAGISSTVGRGSLVEFYRLVFNRPLASTDNPPRSPE